MKNENMILRTIVGSRAHGLATPQSDTDYRGVFIQPTKEILSIGGHTKTTNWIEDKNDDTSFEIGHFLTLSLQSNPTILETYLAPVDFATEDGIALRQLFPYVWSSQRVKDAFCGYGFNQRKKMLEDKDKRPNKYAAAYLRVLYNAYELLSTGAFTVGIANTEVGETVRRFKEGNFTHGECIDVCREWQAKVEQAFLDNPVHEPNVDKINEFLLKIRMKYL